MFAMDGKYLQFNMLLDLLIYLVIYFHITSSFSFSVK